MDLKHKNVLKKHRLLLANELIGDEVYQFLVEKGILSDHLIEKISSKSTNFNQNIEFLTLLPKRGPSAFAYFIESLHVSNQSHLASSLVQSISESSKKSTLDNEINATIASTLPVEQVTQSLDNDSIVVKSFSFSTSPVSTFSTTTTDHNQSSIKRPISECKEYRSDVDMSPLRVSLTKKQRFDDYQSELIPSPCGSLDDILCTSPIASLISCSHVKCNQLSSKFLANKTSDVCLSGITGMSKNVLFNCDLADGPSLEDLIVRPSRKKECYYGDCYPMRSTTRGMALIISVEHFEASSHLENRQAAEVDKVRIEFVLRQLGFKCYLLVDGTAEEIWNVLQKFVALDDHYNMDVSMLVAMSHGEEGCFFGRDGKPVFINKIINLFNNENCKGLHHKPKVLLFQSCRGNVPDQGVIDVSDGPHRPRIVTAPEADLTSSRSSLNASYSKLPTHSDCLVGFATVKGFAAMRNTRHGSWYIQALVRVLAFHACDKHLVEVMTMVNQLVKEKEGSNSASIYHRCKEMSIFHSTLCKKLYLFPT